MPEVLSPVRAHPLVEAVRRVRRSVLRHRRGLAALAAAAAVLAGLLAVAPPEPATRVLLVAARDLPAGARLGAGDLRPTRVPVDVAPAGALSAADGEVLAAPVRRGEPVTDARIVGPGLLPRGSVADEEAVPIRLSDAAQAALLEPGDQVDLLATDPASGHTERVAEQVSVLAVPPLPTEGSGAAGAASAGGSLGGRLVVVALPGDVAEVVTGAAVTTFVTFAWTPR